MTKAKLRNFWFQIHKWIGLTLAIIFMALSFTGSILVWDDPIDRLLKPARYVDVGPIAFPISSYVATARKALPPGSRVVSVQFGSGPVTVLAAPSRPGRMRGPPLRFAAWVDPATGKLIDSGVSTSRLLRWVHVFHGSLQIAGWGRAVVGWLGVLLLISSLTGIWLWWPLSGSVARGFRWKRQPALDANLHHLIGFWVALPLAMLALTGVIIAWPQMIGSGGMRRPAAMPVASPNLSVDYVLAEASVKSRAVVIWPTDQEPDWSVKAGRAAMVKIVDATGDIELATDGDREPRRPLYRRLHDGTRMGGLYQLAIVLAGLAPALLGVTGIIMWLRTRKWRGPKKP